MAIVSKLDQSDWDTHLESCLFAYRISVNQKLAESPFYLLYGRDHILQNDLVFGVQTTRVAPAENIDHYKFQLVTQLKQAYEELEQKRAKQADYYKFRYDTAHKDIEFEEGTQVMIYWPVPKKGLSQKVQ